MTRRVLLTAIGAIGIFPVSGMAEGAMYVGGAGGIATLSADGRSLIAGNSPAASLYKPENGPALNLFGGRHLTRFVTLQANYVWNRNGLAVSSIRFSDSGGVSYEQQRASSQHGVLADLLVYFRDRESRIRPYLSAGAGWVHFKSKEGALVSSTGNPQLPPHDFTSTAAALRVAVGIDVALSGRWSLRYSFSETIRGNPVSEQMSPPGQRNLANFQNLFGILRRF